MADNTTINSGTGGDVIATDDVTTLNGNVSSGVKVQRVKVTYGDDNSARDVSSAFPLPVTVPTDQADQLSDMVRLLVDILGRLGVNNGLGRMLVDTSGTVAISGTPAVAQSGTWTVQPGNTQNTTAWLVQNQGTSTQLYGPPGYMLDQFYASQQAFGTLRDRMTVT